MWPSCSTPTSQGPRSAGRPAWTGSPASASSIRSPGPGCCSPRCGSTSTFAWRFGRSGQEPPDTGPVQALLEADLRQPGQLRAAVAELHRQLLMALTAADFRLGKAYGLGRALAQTALLPDATHPETFGRTFARFRLDNLLGWLADLRSAFPPHAAEAVSAVAPGVGGLERRPDPAAGRRRPGAGAGAAAAAAAHPTGGLVGRR